MGQVEKGVPGIWGPLKLLVYFTFSRVFILMSNALGVGVALRLLLQHQGQGPPLVRERGDNLCPFLGERGGRYAISPVPDPCAMQTGN